MERAERLFGLKTAQINALQSVFAQYPAIDQVILYGSRAKGNYKLGSDIDLTIIDIGMTYDALVKLENSIDDLLLPYKIDLSLKREIDNPNLIAHIDRVGQVFYDKNAVTVAMEPEGEYGQLSTSHQSQPKNSINSTHKT